MRRPEWDWGAMIAIGAVMLALAFVASAAYLT
jgi:hypothetical protein